MTVENEPAQSCKIGASGNHRIASGGRLRRRTRAAAYQARSFAECRPWRSSSGTVGAWARVRASVRSRVCARDDRGDRWRAKGLRRKGVQLIGPPHNDGGDVLDMRACRAQISQARRVQERHRRQQSRPIPVARVAVSRVEAEERVEQPRGARRAEHQVFSTVLIVAGLQHRERGLHDLRHHLRLAAGRHVLRAPARMRQAPNRTHRAQRTTARTTTDAVRITIES